MKNLLIIGARGYGREVSLLAKGSIGFNTDFQVKGFLDDKKDALDGLGDFPKILGDVEDYAIQANDVFICALGDVKWKKHYVDLILAKGGIFTTLIHKSASIGIGSTVGGGSIIERYVTITANCSVGNYTTISINSLIGHDASIGDFCHISAFTFMGGGCSLGDFVTVHPHASILPRKKVGNHVIVGAGSVVIRDIKEGNTVFGVPARRI